jgi:geranylgeranyl reductase family protein
MKSVAVIGGGPAGSFAAERLASAGFRTLLLDEKLAWEKPCGGGLTYKAYHEYPFLLNNDTRKKVIRRTVLSAPGAGSSELDLTHPLLIYSRFDFNDMLLRRAESAGAQVEKTRVLEVAPSPSGERWKLRTRHGTIDADFCIVATGARNSFRNVGTEWTAEDTMCAIGYYVPSSQEHIDIQFLPNFEGYIWVFPRCGHLSAGICGKGMTTQAMRRRLERYLDEKGISYRDAKFYGHVIPCLDHPAWRRNRVAGPAWFAVGDAAGLVDPVTGEGLYYALRSADLATRVLCADRHPLHAPACQDAYRQSLTHDFTADLEYGARLAKRLFLGRLLFGNMTSRMVQFMRYSDRFRVVMQDLFAGTQPYLDLKQRLVENLNGTMLEVVMGFLLHRFVPGESKV